MEILSPENYFLQQGILGVIIVVLGGVIIWQQRQLDKKYQEIKELYKAIDVVQEKRLADNAQHITSIVALGANLVNADAAIQKSLDNIARVLEMRGQ